MKILIVEDEENIAKGIAAIIKSQSDMHCHIEFAVDGREALNFARISHPDLLITDIRMPMMNGLELIKILKDEKLCGHGIIISGYDNFSYAQTAVRYGLLDYLLKPVDKNRLLELVTHVYHELPQNYSKKLNRTLPDIPYFSLKFDIENYPTSLKKVINYIEKNYMKDLSLQSISDEFMFHANYISSLINKYTQHSFTYLLDYIRIRKAAELLLFEQDITISEISYLVGYNNERRLYHAFQKRLNRTPGDFRNLYLIQPLINEEG